MFTARTTFPASCDKSSRQRMVDAPSPLSAQEQSWETTIQGLMGSSGLLALCTDDSISRLLQGLSHIEPACYGFYYTTSVSGQRTVEVLFPPQPGSYQPTTTQRLLERLRDPLVQQVHIRQLVNPSSQQPDDERKLHACYRSLLATVLPDDHAASSPTLTEESLQKRQRRAFAPIRILVQRLEQQLGLPVSKMRGTFATLLSPILGPVVNLPLPPHSTRQHDRMFDQALIVQQPCLQRATEAFVKLLMTDRAFFNRICSSQRTSSQPTNQGSTQKSAEHWAEAEALPVIRDDQPRSPELLEALGECSAARLDDLRRLVSHLETGQLPVAVLHSMIGEATIEAQQIALLRHQPPPPLVTFDSNHCPEQITLHQVTHEDSSRFHAKRRQEPQPTQITFPVTRKRIGAHEQPRPHAPSLMIPPVPSPQSPGRGEPQFSWGSDSEITPHNDVPVCSDLEHLDRCQLLELLRQLDTTESEGQAESSACDMLRHEIAQQLALK